MALDVGLFIEPQFSVNLLLDKPALRLLAELDVDLEISIYACAAHSD